MDLTNLLMRFDAFWEGRTEYHFTPTEWATLGHHFIRMREFSKVEKILDWGLQEDPDAYVLHILKVRYLLDTGKEEEAYRHIRFFKKFFPEHRIILFYEYLYFQSVGDYPKQYELLRKLQKIYPQNRNFVFDLIFVCSVLNKIPEALKWINILFNKFLGWISRDDFKLIVNFFEQHPNDELFSSYLEQYLKHRPFDQNAWDAYARCFMRKKDFKNARKAWEYALSIDEEYLSAYLGLAEMYEELGDYATANEYLFKAFTFTDLSASLLTRTGMNFEKMGMEDKAMDFYHQALEEDRTYLPAWENILFGYLRQNRLEKALETADQALEMIETKRFYYHKARILMKLKRYADAKSFFEKSFELGYREKSFFLEWLDTAIKTGDLDLFKQILSAAIKHHPADSEFEDLINKMKNE